MNTDALGNEIGKLFIGGLHQNTTNETLKKYFSTFGQIEQAIVMIDNNTQRSRGFGYVKYVEDDSVNNVLNAAPHTIDDKEVDAKRCNINMKGKNRRSLKIFVGGVAPDVNESAIRDFFSSFGNVVDVNLMIDPVKQRHRGFAFVGFDEEEVVRELITMRHAIIGGKTVEMKPMEPPNSRRGGPGNNFNPMFNPFAAAAAGPAGLFTGPNGHPFFNISRAVTGNNPRAAVAAGLPNGYGVGPHHPASAGMLHPRFATGPAGNADSLLNLQHQFQQMNGAPQGLWTPAGAPNSVGTSNSWHNSGLEHWSNQMLINDFLDMEINNGAPQGIPALWGDNGLMSSNGTDWTSTALTNMQAGAQDCGIPRGIPYMGWQQHGNAAGMLSSMPGLSAGHHGAVAAAAAAAAGVANVGNPLGNNTVNPGIGGSVGIVNHAPQNGNQALSNTNTINNSMPPQNQLNVHHSSQNQLQSNLQPNQNYNFSQNSLVTANMMQMAAAATNNNLAEWRGPSMTQHSSFNPAFNR